MDLSPSRGLEAVMLRFIIRRWFLWALAAVIVAGFGFPGLFGETARGVPREWVVCTVMFLTALPLDSRVMWRAMRHPKAVLLAVAINFGLLPLFAWAISTGLRADMASGLMIAAAAPCTLASAAVWTRRAGGNDAVAILVTMVTNLSCFVITPFWLLVSTEAGDVGIDPVEMTRRLGLLVVLPTLAAQLIRLHRPTGVWATRQKLPLAVMAQCGILTMVFVGSVNAGVRLASHEVVIGWFDWLTMPAATLGVHLAMLFAGHLLGRSLGVGPEDRIAVGFSGSQKTLMVGLDVSLKYFAHQPLAMLPMVIYHVGQLVVDTVIADKLRERRRK